MLLTKQPSGRIGCAHHKDGPCEECLVKFTREACEHGGIPGLEPGPCLDCMVLAAAALKQVAFDYVETASEDRHERARAHASLAARRIQ